MVKDVRGVFDDSRYLNKERYIVGGFIIGESVYVIYDSGIGRVLSGRYNGLLDVDDGFVW